MNRREFTKGLVVAPVVAATVGVPAASMALDKPMCAFEVSRRIEEWHHLTKIPAHKYTKELLQYVENTHRGWFYEKETPLEVISESFYDWRFDEWYVRSTARYAVA